MAQGKGRAHADIGWGKYLLSLAIVAVPAILLERGDERLAWRYVTLILLMLIVWHSEGLQTFSAYVLSEIQGAHP